MPRTLVTLFVLAALGHAAPVPQAKPKAPFHPTAVGTKWEYIRAGNEKTLWVEEVTEREEKDGTVTFKVQVTTTLGTKQWAKYRVRDGALAQLGDGVDGSEGEDSPSPQVLRDTDWTPGESVTQKFTYDQAQYEEVVSVGKPEEVNTQAGKFTAVPVSRKPSGGKASTSWYADGVGLVRECEDGATTPRMELKSFTPGKDKN
jgi:hypothetical protein